MAIKTEQERVHDMVKHSITFLCQAGLQYTKTLKIQGLLGITMDDSEVLLIQMHENIVPPGSEASPITDFEKGGNIIGMLTYALLQHR